MVDYMRKMSGKKCDKHSPVTCLWIHLINNIGILEVVQSSQKLVNTLSSYLKLLYTTEITKFSFQTDSHQNFNHDYF